MNTTKGNNVDVVSVRGNFDACQRLVKQFMKTVKLMKFTIMFNYQALIQLISAD